MTIKTQITTIKGDGTYPPPKTRRIYPTSTLFWKYYLKSFLGWVVAMGSIFLIFRFFSFIASIENEFVIFTNPEFQSQVFFLVLACSLVLIPVILILITLYIRNMEFIVHGDEIIVKKGLFNKTVKYCPFRAITNVSTHVGVFDRLFKIGCINIQTAGGGGMKGGLEEKLEGLKVYSEIREYIVRQLRLFTGPSDPSIPSDHTFEGSKDVLQENILLELKEIKKEFTRRKRSELNE